MSEQKPFSIIDKKYFLIIISVVSFLIVDLVISGVADFLVQLTTSIWGVLLFAAFGIGFAIQQYKLLKVIHAETKETRARSKFLNGLDKILKFVTYTLTLIFLIVVGELLVISQYHTIALIVATIIGMASTSILLVVFGFKFFSWYQVDKKSIVVLMYGLSFVVSGSALFVVSGGDIFVMLSKDQLVTAQTEVIFPSYEEGSFFNIFFNLFVYLTFGSFLLLLISTSILLKHYAKKIGRLKFWIIMSIPAIIYFGSNLDAFNIYNGPDNDKDLFYYYILQSLGTVAGAILFGFVFVTVARVLQKDNPLRKYLMMAAYGIVLLEISTQSTVNPTPYPPFGLYGVSLMVLSSYMAFSGLYSAAISLSQDLRLRQTIRTVVSQDTSLISSIGTAQMDHEVQRTVRGMKNTIEKEESEMSQKTGIETPIPQDDMENYMKQVLEEVARARKMKQT